MKTNTDIRNLLQNLKLVTRSMKNKCVRDGKPTQNTCKLIDVLHGIRKYRNAE